MKKIIAFVFCLFLSSQVLAKNNFSALVPVDVEAENSVIAKDKAMVEAQRNGFMEVASHLVDADNLEKLKNLNDEEILHFVLSVSVANEKAGGTKYKADLTVEINEMLLKEYLAENDMIKLESTELMIIPIYKPQTFSAPLLWEDENLWRKNWVMKGRIKFGTLQVHTIGNHFRDISELNADSALYMNPDLYGQLSERNGSDKIYVIYAEKIENGDLKITVKDEKNKAEDYFTVINSGDDLYDTAIEKSVMFISNMERSAQSLENNVANGTVNAVYSYQNMKEWIDKSKAIMALANVENLDTKSFGGGKVNFTITYTGTQDELWSALQSLGLSHENFDNYVILR